MYTVQEVAHEFGATTETVRRWLRSGRISGFMPGGQKLGYRIPASEVERLRQPAPARPKQSAAVLIANLRDQAERARTRGDEEGAARFEAMAAEAASAAQHRRA